MEKLTGNTIFGELRSRQR